jgi:hypothetical protein
MIRFLKHNEIDFQKWDQCLAKCLNNNIYAQSWYLNIVCSTWHALVLDDYLAVMPLYERVSWGVPTIRQPMLSQQLGLFSKSSGYNFDDFFHAIPKKYLYINFNLNYQNSASHFSFKKNVNHELFIDSDKHKLIDNYSKSVKNNIAKAKSNTISISPKPDHVEQFCSKKKELAKAYMNERLNDAQYKLINYCLANKKGRIFSAQFDGLNCCSIFIMFFNDRLILQSSYCNDIGKKYGAFFFLLDHILNCEEFNNFIFDFEGSNLEGVAKRNLGFGAKETHYQSVRLSRIPFVK